MKQKKAHASHPVGNRTVIGIICIVVALAICFGIAPLVNRLSDGKTKIVRLTRDISAGATITEADIEVVDVGSYNLPTGVIKDKVQVVGKCALSNLTKGDYLFPSKIGNDTNNAGRMLESLDENHKAISITIGSFALGFSGKLETGDIVRILVYDQVENRSYTPKELTYVKVITTTTSSGVDKADVEDKSQPVTVTLLVNDEQAELLAFYEKVADMLISRVEPTRSGYTFLGWSTSPSASSASYQPGEWYYANADRTFYAVWKKNAPATYTVSYDANGGSGAPGSQTKTENVTLTLSPVSPRRTGYTFKGWATNKFMPGAQYQPGGKYTANASVTLYALWECAHTSTEKKWTTGCEWKTVCKNCGATISSGTTHGPFSYGAWEYYSTGQHKRVKECNYGDYSTTEYASHRATTRYEQYSASQHRKYSHCTDCDTTIGSVSYENHSFTSSTSNGQVVSTCSLCGYTKTTAQTYTVSYNANGGSNAPPSQTKVHGVTLTLSSTVPYRTNYEFVGWSASSSATTATYTAGGSYTGNASVTLFAVWKYKPATYTVGYDANGGTGAPGRQTKTYGVTLTLTTLIPTRRNYSFVGWSKDRNATSASYTAGGSYTDNADVTLYAVWQYNPETYTVRYDANGGTGAPASQTKTYGVPLTLSAVKPTRAGYEFLGWATSRNATVSEYAPGERYTDEAGVTL
ncbi:MAG: hypothetical protein DBX65_08370, partial [Oscillospiraceae bacterium]